MTQTFVENRANMHDTVKVEESPAKADSKVIDYRAYQEKVKKAKDDVVGTLIGFIIVNFIMNALFPGMWWGKVAIYAVAYGFIEAIFKLYEIHNNVEESAVKARDDMTGVWLALILVNTIWDGLGFHAWFFQIVPLVLTISGIVNTIGFIAKLGKYLKGQPVPQQEMGIPAEVPMYAKPAPIPIASIQKTETVFVSNALEHRFCGMCGEKIDADAKFCPFCGNQSIH